MAFRPALRPLTTVARTGLSSAARGFHSTRPAFVKVGDSIPSVESLMEGSPGNKVDLSQELQGADGVILGVPGAFSPGCSQKHVPSYLTHPNLKASGKVFVVSVNDPFVMKAWGESLDPSGVKGVRFIADPKAEFTKALDLDFDATKIFGNSRSKRYALVVKGGQVVSTHIEPDGTGTNESMANKVLGPAAQVDWDS